MQLQSSLPLLNYLQCSSNSSNSKHNLCRNPRQLWIRTIPQPRRTNPDLTSTRRRKKFLVFSIRIKQIMSSIWWARSPPNRHKIISAMETLTEISFLARSTLCTESVRCSKTTRTSQGSSVEGTTLPNTTLMPSSVRSQSHQSFRTTSISNISRP